MQILTLLKDGKGGRPKWSYSESHGPSDTSDSHTYSIHSKEDL